MILNHESARSQIPLKLFSYLELGLSMDFEQKVAIVTGGAMGIGKACAQIFLQGGARVVIADVNLEEGERTAKELGENSLFVKTDVCSLSAMQNMADAAIAAFGKIDILVNNAAIAVQGVVDQIDEDIWAKVINTNLSGFWRGMKVCVPEMRKQNSGVIVNISSVQGLCAFEGWSAYATAKGGINALTIQASLDLAPVGIRVNAVAPGTIMTPLNEKIFKEHEDPKTLIETWNRAHPLGRFGQPNEVAETVAFLASERASFITGEIIRVDGGLVIRGT